jgi:hypothetical protein
MPRKPQQTLPPPLDAGDPERLSLDATDWRMYRDRLQDAGAPENEWQRASNIAASLAQDVKLVVVSYCPARSLKSAQHGNHWLRIGKTWFIGADGTCIEGNRLVWWRRDWVWDGFARYPSADPHRDEGKLTELNYGTPWDMPHPRWSLVRARKRFYKTVIGRFFDGHGAAEIPAEYL